MTEGDPVMEMDTAEKPKRNWSRLEFVLTVVVPCAVVLVLALLWCSWMIPRSVDTAMKRSILLYKADIITKLTTSMNRVAFGEIIRLNQAEEEYGKQVRFEPMLLHPMGWGFWLKVKRKYDAYEIVDMAQTGSLIAPYEVIAGYHYKVFQTQKQASMDSESQDKAWKDVEFKETDTEGAVEMLYRFDADFQWDGTMGEIVRVVGNEPLLPFAGLDDPRRKLSLRAGKIVGWAPSSYYR